MPVIADDLFAGVGGWDLAAGTLGVQARGVEIDAAARATRDAAGLVTIHDDVWTYQPDDQAQGLIASPPCQTFSKAGKGTGRRALVNVTQALATDAYTSRDELRELGEVVGDERTALVLLPLHFATQHGHYRWLAWEQTSLVLPVWEACAAILRELGWRVWTGNLRAEQYGVPQTRTRAVLLARQDGDALPPLPTHSRYRPTSPERLDEGVAPWVTMADALTWGMTLRPYPTVAPGCSLGGGSGPDPMVVGGSGARAVVYGARDAGQWIERPAFMGDVVTTRSTVRHVLEPAPTLTARYKAPTAESNVRHQARNDGVRLTVAEAGVLQGFPATFPWRGTRTEQFRQVGNAIPPPMAAATLAQVCPQAADHANTDDREGAA